MRTAVQRFQQEDKLEIGNTMRHILQWTNGGYSEWGCVQKKASASKVRPIFYPPHIHAIKAASQPVWQGSASMLSPHKHPLQTKPEVPGHQVHFILAKMTGLFVLGPSAFLLPLLLKRHHPPGPIMNMNSAAPRSPLRSNCWIVTDFQGIGGYLIHSWAATFKAIIDPCSLFFATSPPANCSSFHQVVL